MPTALVGRGRRGRVSWFVQKPSPGLEGGAQINRTVLVRKEARSTARVTEAPHDLRLGFDWGFGH